MSETKKLNKVGLSQVWAKIVANFVAKQDGKELVDTTLIQKLNNMKADGEANVIEKVSVNGVELSVSEKGVDITVPTGTLAGLDEVGQEQLSAALAAVIAGKATRQLPWQDMALQMLIQKRRLMQLSMQRLQVCIRCRGQLLLLICQSRPKKKDMCIMSQMALLQTIHSWKKNRVKSFRLEQMLFIRLMDGMPWQEHMTLAAIC